MIAVNHARAQIMAPHREADPGRAGPRGRGVRCAGDGVRRTAETILSSAATPRAGPTPTSTASSESLS